MHPSRAQTELGDLTGQLLRRRRPDVSLGLLLARELVCQLIDIPADHARVIAIAIGDLADAVHPDAERVLAELHANPDGDYLIADGIEGW
jgi:hypothetical protein